MKNSRGRLAVVHAVIVLALIVSARAMPAPLSRWLQIVAATLQIYWPLVAFEPEGLRCALRRLYGRDVLREAAWALLTLAMTLPPWRWLAYRFVVPASPPVVSPVALCSWASLSALAEMSLVAAQEEWFWRGYVQAALGHSAFAIGLSSVLFGGCHWAFSGSPVAMATALPSLVFGLLARRQGGLIACTLVHIGDNLMSRLVFSAR